MTTTDIATTNGTAEAEVARAAARSAIELTADQHGFTPTQVAALKQLGIDDAPAAQLDLFFHRCRITRLDPFSKQIYLIGRETKVGGYRGEPERRETKWTIQTGIDGYRLNGHRAAAEKGESVKTEGPFWQGADGGGWNDVWLGGRGNPPAAAKFVIIADGEPHVGIAMYEEFVQTKYNGDPNAMWSKMPANQLAKCAEAQAWRKAYPEDFSGLQLEDAVQIIEPDGSPVRATAERADRVNLAALTDKVAPGTPGGVPVKNWEPSAETADDGSTSQLVTDTMHEMADEMLARRADPGGDTPTEEQVKALGAALKAEGLRTRKAQLDYLTKEFKREITAPTDLTALEAQQITDYLVVAQSADAAKAGE